MHKALRAGLPLAAAAALLVLSTPATANVVAGNGYSSSYAGESAFTNVDAGGSGQASAIFFNSGTQIWYPGVVGLLVCAPDKVSCNVPWNAAFNKGWFSPTAYATVATAVAPGQNAFFIYSFTVPTGTPAGTVTTFNGDVGLIATGAVLRPEGYFHVNAVPTPPLSLTVSPAVAAVAVGSYQQFVVTGQPAGAPVTWSVTGGCGAITAAGLFVATAMNSSSQPCSAVASAMGWKGSAAITVYGPVAQLACSVTPSRIAADGGATTGGIATARITFKDSNGSVVANAYAPPINVINVTPSLAQMSPVGTVAPSAGVVTITITSTTTPGDIQLSASAAGLTGCNVVLTSNPAGVATKTVATILQSPIAADNLSTTTLQVDVTDANGVRVLSDNLTQLAVTLQSGAGTCRLVSISQGMNPSVTSSFASAVAAQGRAAFTVQSTGAPGRCLFVVTTNNSSIAGTSATLTTQTVGAPARLAILSNDSPHPASSIGVCDLGSSPSDPSCTKIVVGVTDANGVLVTGDSGRGIVLGLSQSLCSGAGGDVLQRGSTSTLGGKATFVFSSAGAYGACAITFTSASLVGVSATAV